MGRKSSKQGLTKHTNGDRIISNKGLLSQNNSQLLKSKDSFQDNIKEHKDKISNPEKYSSDWDEISDEKRKGRIKHWRKEIFNWEKQIADIDMILKERGGDNDDKK